MRPQANRYLCCTGRYCAPAILIAATFAAYATSFRGVIHFNDYTVLLDDPATQSFAAWTKSLGSGLRPLSKLTYLFNRHLGGGLTGLHTVNIAVHALAAVSVFCIGRRVFRDGCLPLWQSPAFWAAMLFAVHPVHTEAVTYISGRTTALAALFCAGSLLAFSVPSDTRHARLMWYVASPLLFAAALMCKETVVLLPLGLFWWEVCTCRGRTTAALAKLRIHGAMLIGFTVVVLANSVMFRLAAESVGRYSIGEAFVRHAHGLIYLLSRLIAVNRLCIDPALDGIARSAAANVGTVLLAAGLCAGTFLLRFRYRSAAFALGWFMLFSFLQFLPMPRSDIVNERHAYPANMGLFLLSGAFVGALLQLRRYGAAVAAALVIVCVLLAATTSIRSLDYHDPLRLWESTVRLAPHNPRAWSNLGLAWERGLEFEKALRCYEKALGVRPDYAPAHAHRLRVTQRMRIKKPVCPVEKTILLF